LTRYGATHPAGQIREAIVDPNKNFDKRRGTVVVTAAGKRYRGVIRNEDNFSLQVQTLDGEFHFFEKGDAVRIEREAGSLMPADYGSTLTSEELDDLVRYVSGNAEGKSGGRRGAKGGDGGEAK
jgi:cytochrome c oxidase cbb3-type subunit 3